MIDKPTWLAVVTAYGEPEAALMLEQIPDADPLHVKGEWAASMGRTLSGFIGSAVGFGPVAYGTTQDDAAKRLYVELKATVDAAALKADQDKQAADARVAAVGAAVPKGP